MANDKEKDVAKSIGLMQINTEEAINDVAFDILYSMYRHSPKKAKDQMAEFEKTLRNPKLGLSEVQIKERLVELKEFTEEAMNEKIKETFKKWTGGNFYDVGDKVKSTLLLGPPGQGKTTTFKEAAKKVAQALNLKFKLNPGDEQSINPDDFMFVSMEFSGENQITTLGGIPAKVMDDLTGTEYMTKLCNKRLALAQQAGGALLLLDDFPNAAPSVQNVGLSLTDEKRFQGLNLENVYIGLTGNLGSLDGTHTTRLSTALRGRCKIFYTEDELPKWITRVQQKYRDPIGDAGIIGFLHRESPSFAQMPDTRLQGGFPSPRTWDHFVQEVRREIVKAGGPGNEMKAMPKIQSLAGSILGLEIGQKVYSYYYSLMQGADPLARALICDGEFNKAKFNEKHGDGFSAESQQFAFQFVLALGDWAVKELVNSDNKAFNPEKNKNFKEVMERFAKGVAATGESLLGFAVDHFKNKLANQMDEWCNQSVPGKTRSLSPEVKKEMVLILGKAPGFDEKMRDIMVAAFSDYDKFSSYKASRRG